MSKGSVKVIKRDGRITDFDPSKIVKAVTMAMEAVSDVDMELAEAIASEVALNLDGYKKLSVEDIQDIVEKALFNSGTYELTKAYLLYRHDRAGVRELKDYFGVDGDLKQFGVNALALLSDRYLKRGSDGKKETPAEMFRRVAKAVASIEKRHGGDPNKWSKAFYNLMVDQYFLPNTPCLTNAGNKDLNNLFACYAFEVGDSIDEIFEATKQCAIVQKTGGGVGLNLSKLRPSNDTVKTTEGIASGPVSFMKNFDVASDVIKQGGIRRGGNLGLMIVSHPDIVLFINCKNSEGDFENFNISVAITDEFMDAVTNGESFDLINPKNNNIVSTVDARELFSQLAEAAWRKGEPGIVFWDQIERDNPTPSKGHLIKNLCGEQDLLPFEACCLGSINLSKFVSEDGDIEWNALKKTINHAVRFLDNVIDVSDYPLPQIEKIVKSNRKIGLGVMGFANMLFYLGVPYDSIEAIKVAEDVMSFIQKESIAASAQLAKDRGDFPNINDSTLKSPRRNAMITTIAPTGSISMIAETSHGIEPLFGVVFSRENILGGKTFFEINPVFEEIAKKEGWWSSELISKITNNHGRVRGILEIPEKWQKIFVTALEISPEWHLMVQAAFQKYVDSSISKTVNLPYEATVDDVKNIIKLSYSLGLKGLTVYRNKSRTEQVMKSDDLCVDCEGGVCKL